MMGGLSRVQTYTPEECRVFMLEYQKSRDPMLFAKLLVRFDNLLIYAVHFFRRRHREFRNEYMEDLYHTAMAAMGDAVLTFREQDGPEKMGVRIFSYIKAAFFRDYKYLFVEVDRMINSPLDEIPYLDSFTAQETSTTKLDIDHLLEQFNKEEMECFRYRYVEGYSMMETSAIMNITKHRVRMLTERVRNTLVDQVSSDE